MRPMDRLDYDISVVQWLYVKIVNQYIFVVTVMCSCLTLEFGEGTEEHITSGQIEELQAIGLKAYNADQYNSLADALVSKYVNYPRMERIPPSEAALQQHQKRSEISILISKTTVHGIPDRYSFDEYG